MENYVFSVIVPCYNSQAYIIPAIESIVNQTYPYWELIIVNDGSIDNTLKIVNSYATKDNRIKVYSKENGGYTTAVNYGLDRITGDYFLFMGSDDRLDTNLFANIYKEISATKSFPDCIAFRTRQVINDVIQGVENDTNFDTLVYEPNILIKDFKEKHPAHSAIFTIRDTSKCFKTSLLKDLRYFGKYGIDSDGIFSMLFTHKASSFLSIPVDGYYWYIRNGSVSSTTSIHKQLDRLDCWYKFFKILTELDQSLIYKREKFFFRYYADILLPLCISRSLAIKYHSLIKKHAKFIKNNAELFDFELPSYIKTASTLPCLYAFKCSIKRLFKKK